jgi:NTE family protein
MSNDAPVDDRPTRPEVTLVLSGGHALGAYLAGVYEALHVGGLRPNRIVGSSTGAVTAAILSGNPPERRLDQLRRYWDEAAQAETWPYPPQGGPLRQAHNAAHAFLAAAMGRPSIFRPRWFGPWSMLALPWLPGELALHDHAPLCGTLERLVDFDLLNRAGPRLSLGCVDIETGEEVWFDSARERIDKEHVLASAALMPHLPPVAIGGRVLCDPGYANNLPVDQALSEPPERDLLCLAVELFSLRGTCPTSLEGAMRRMQDIMFASHSGHHVAALRREYALRGRLEPEGPAVTLVHIVYEAPAHEVAAKMLDFSRASLEERWAAGRRDTERALGLIPSGAGGARERFAYIRSSATDNLPAVGGYSKQA